jgi:hypothetical protein
LDPPLVYRDRPTLACAEIDKRRFGQAEERAVQRRHQPVSDAILRTDTIPTAHVLARLRIDGRVAASVARLATGWVGFNPSPGGARTRWTMNRIS